jgi:hypothetical protein
VMPRFAPFKPTRPKAEESRLMFEYPKLALDTGAIAAGNGSCAIAREAYSNRQNKLWQTNFIARWKARGSNFRTRDPSCFSKNPGLGDRKARMEGDSRKGN